jgi:2-methylcitrate dehydratase PrpD
MAMPGHPTVAILPALLALAEQRGSSGAAVLTAFVAGYELQCRIGRAIAPGHYDGLGFHATATVGSFGAAAACAHLLGLDAAGTATALGIAGTQAAGLKSMFGTMCKPLHAGKASCNGLLAARLAARGFTSRDDVLECAQGFASTHSPDFDPEKAYADPPRGWWIFDNLFKYHAACYLTHGPIEAARKLRAEHGVPPEQVARVRLRVDQATDRVCNIPAPRTGLEAKFSLRLTTAMALAGVETGALGAYSEANAADPRLVALRDKVTPDFQTGWPHTLAEVEIELADGTRRAARHDAGVPEADIGRQGEKLERKFAALVEPLLDGRAGEIIGLVRRLDALENVHPVMALCA